ncbi:MAG: hypothetical protein KDD45_10095, partial [Bdellovibrionales bacterium]|nr:hypothetical protein [Bdellovibrionales bacterium]
MKYYISRFKIYQMIVQSNSAIFNLLVLVCVIGSLFFSIKAKAEKEILFEGYFKILINKQHIGYSISRYEFDSKKQEFFVTIFTKTGALGG